MGGACELLVCAMHVCACAHNCVHAKFNGSKFTVQKTSQKIFLQWYALAKLAKIFPRAYTIHVVLSLFRQYDELSSLINYSPILAVAVPKTCRTHSFKARGKEKLMVAGMSAFALSHIVCMYTWSMGSIL